MLYNLKLEFEYIEVLAIQRLAWMSVEWSISLLSCACFASQSVRFPLPTSWTRLKTSFPVCSFQFVCNSLLWVNYLGRYQVLLCKRMEVISSVVFWCWQSVWIVFSIFLRRQSMTLTKCVHYLLSVLLCLVFDWNVLQVPVHTCHS